MGDHFYIQIIEYEPQFLWGFVYYHDKKLGISFILNLNSKMTPLSVSLNIFISDIKSKMIFLLSKFS